MWLRSGRKVWVDYQSAFKKCWFSYLVSLWTQKSRNPKGLEGQDISFSVTGQLFLHILKIIDYSIKLYLNGILNWCLSSVYLFCQEMLGFQRHLCYGTYSWSCIIPAPPWGTCCVTGWDEGQMSQPHTDHIFRK